MIRSIILCLHKLINYYWNICFNIFLPLWQHPWFFSILRAYLFVIDSSKRWSVMFTEPIVSGLNKDLWTQSEIQTGTGWTTNQLSTHPEPFLFDRTTGSMPGRHRWLITTYLIWWASFFPGPYLDVHPYIHTVPRNNITTVRPLSGYCGH